MLTHINSKFIYIASFVCIIHCIATPLIIFFLPFLGGVLENHWVELSVYFVSIIFGIILIYKGFCLHNNRYLILLYSMGAALWLVHLILEHEDINGAKVSLIIGTCIILISYYVNYRLLKRCPHSCCKP